MTTKTPKYALINDEEVTLLEVIPHISSHETICIFENNAKERHFVSQEEWKAAAEQFTRYAVSAQLVTSESSAQDKIALFKSLFKGRDDVYAHGYAKKDGSIGYVPTCANERTKLCPRWTRVNPKIKCADCPARQFMPLSDRALINHFRGELGNLSDVIGLYVLTLDLKTWVLVADFDEKDWQKETTLYKEACINFGLFPAIERSRSGNGAHVWLFFEEPIDAELARNLGCVLITWAMNQASEIGFESYDRLFPTQSTIPEGGLGNLIALPFQGQAQRQLNSVFMDDAFDSYPDQWRFLSSVKKASLKQVQEIVDSAHDGPLGQLAFTGQAHQQTHKQSELFNSVSGAITPAHAPHSTSVTFPQSITIIKANMLYVDKEGLSSKAQNLIRRLAAFGNPEFYRAQAMHQSVYGKKRIIWCGEEDEHFIMIPRGCEQKLIDLAQAHNFTCSFVDKRNQSEAIHVDFLGVLRNGQQKAADALLNYENGILMAPPGFGKTVVGAYLIAVLKMRTLVIVPRTSLVEQWKERLEQFLSIVDDRPPLLTKSGKLSKRKRSVIGQIGGGKSVPSSIVDVAMFQSLSTKDDLGIPHTKSLVQDYGLVIFDECHCGAAPNFEQVMKSVNARRVYGLSATPKRSDHLEQIIYLHCGPIRHKVDPKEQAAEQGFKRILQPRFTRIRLVSLERGASFNQVVELLCTHPARNALIVEDATNAVKAGRTPLIITNRKEHAACLNKLLREAEIETYMLTGEGSARERREKIKQVKEATHTHYAIVATGSYIGEGFDLPQLDALLLASPYSFEGVITQYSGRLHREHEGKSDVVVYDYVDTSVAMLERMYKKRLKTYAKLGYEISDTDQAQEACARILLAKTWHAELTADVKRADKTVVMSVPYANPQLVSSFISDITSALARGVEVAVILKKPRSEKSRALQTSISETLANTGCKVAICENPLTGIAIFDNKIAWYGTLPLLAFAKADDCALRIESAEVASDLTKALEASTLLLALE